MLRHWNLQTRQNQTEFYGEEADRMKLEETFEFPPSSLPAISLTPNAHRNPHSVTVPI